MKKLFITAACIITILSSFANPATDKNKKNDFATMNATVVVTGTKVIVTALNELPQAIDVTMTTAFGDEVYEGKLTKNEYTQNAILNLEQLGEGTYNIVLKNGKDKIEKKVTINTTKQVSVE